MRTAEQTQTAIFWQVDTPAAIWNRVADELAEAHETTLTENARLLALMNLALADATIAIWSAKNVFDFWRPITAIRLAGFHFRFSCVDGAEIGAHVADYVTGTLMQPEHGKAFGLLRG